MYKSSLCMPHITCLCVCLPQDTELLGDGAGGLFQSSAHTGCVFCEPLCVSYKREDLAPPSGRSPVLGGQKGGPQSPGVMPWIPGWRMTMAALSRSHTSAAGLQVSGKTVQLSKFSLMILACPRPALCSDAPLAWNLQTLSLIIKRKTFW